MMNTFTKTLALALTVIGIASTESFAQATTTAEASAVIVTPLTINRVDHMSFGNVAALTSAGTVLLPATSGGSRVATGVVLPNGQNGTVNPASFTIAGQANYTFSITLPSGNHQIDRNGGVGFMNVTLFTHNLGTTPTLSNTGTQTLLVGATLNVGANQPAGDYKSATPFNVSIVYN